jgi:hypothetical protein
LNHPVEDHALIRPKNYRPCFVKGNEGLNLYLQIVEGLGFSFEKNLIVASDIDDDGLYLVSMGFDTSPSKFDNASGFSCRIEDINQAK